MSSSYTDKSNNTEGIYLKTIKLLNGLFVKMKKHMLILIICMGLGVAPVIISNSLNSKYYKASFTIAYDELFRKIYGDRLGKINSLVQRKEYSKIAYNLRTNIELVKSLKSVQGKNILGEDLTKDLNTDNVPFIVNIVVDDSSKITTIQDAIVNFLEVGNDFLAERKQIRMKENAEEISYINSQLRVIDSLNQHGNTGVGELQKSKNSDAKSNGSLFEFAYELYKRKQELLRKERMPSSLVVVDDAIVSVRPGLSVIYLLAGLILGFMLFVFITMFIIPAIKYKE